MTPTNPPQYSKGGEDYAAAGYRIVSRKYGMISRLDRDDWKEYMAEKHAPWDIEEGRKWVRALGDLHAADHYRRVYSKDTLEIGKRALTLKIQIGKTCTLGY